MSKEEIDKARAEAVKNGCPESQAEIIGKKISSFTVTGYSHKKGKHYFTTQCDCGKEIAKRYDLIKKAARNTSGYCSSLCGLRRVNGVGIYDGADGETRTLCYRRWKGMLSRCYSTNDLIRKPAYKGCSVIEEWHTFSNFKEWYESDPYHNAKDDNGNRFELDKDILLQGNKVYGPDACMFLPQRINTLLTDSKASRGSYPLGVYRSKSNRKNPYRAACDAGRVRGKERLGRFTTVSEAQASYQDFKSNLIVEIASEYEVERPDLYQALLKHADKIRTTPLVDDSDFQ